MQDSTNVLVLPLGRLATRGARAQQIAKKHSTRKQQQQQQQAQRTDRDRD